MTSGNGIGLSTVKQLCEAMGGKVEITNTNLFGTTFTIKTPAYFTN
jgi:signal transduction histidine kinase